MRLTKSGSKSTKAMVTIIARTRNVSFMQQGLKHQLRIYGILCNQRRLQIAPGVVRASRQALEDLQVSNMWMFKGQKCHRDSRQCH